MCVSTEDRLNKLLLDTQEWMDYRYTDIAFSVVCAHMELADILPMRRTLRSFPVRLYRDAIRYLLDEADGGWLMGDKQHARILVDSELSEAVSKRSKLAGNDCALLRRRLDESNLLTESEACELLV